MLAVARRTFPADVFCALLVIPLLLAVEYRLRIADVSFTLAELALPIAAVSVFVVGHNQRQKIPGSFIALALIVALASFLSVFLQSDTKHTLSVYRDFNLPLLFYAAFLSIRLLPAHAFRLAKAFVAWATLSSVVAIAQFYTNNYLWFQSEDTANWQDFKIRLIAESGLGQLLGITDTLSVGLYSHPNNLATYLVIPALVAYVLARSSASRPTSLFWGLCSMTQAAALVCTFSRGSFLTLVVGIIACELLVLRRRTPKPSTIVIAAVLAGAISLVMMNSEAFAFDDLGSFSGRGNMAQAGLALVMERPSSVVTGGLTEAYMGGSQMFTQLVHNLFLYIVLQFGLPTAIAWTLIVTTDLRTSARLASRAGPLSRRIANAALIGVFLTIFFYGQTAPLLDNIQIGLCLFFWMGISRHIVNSEEQHDAELPADGSNTLPTPPEHSGSPLIDLAPPANGVPA